MIRELIGYIGAKHPMQEKYLDKILSELSSDDAKELEEVIEFFSEQHSIEEMGEAYLVFINAFDLHDALLSGGRLSFVSVSIIQDRRTVKCLRRPGARSPARTGPGGHGTFANSAVFSLLADFLAAGGKTGRKRLRGSPSETMIMPPCKSLCNLKGGD